MKLEIKASQVLAEFFSHRKTSALFQPNSAYASFVLRRKLRSWNTPIAFTLINL